MSFLFVVVFKSLYAKIIVNNTKYILDMPMLGFKSPIFAY